MFGFIFMVFVCLFANVTYIMDYNSVQYSWDFSDDEPDLEGCLPGGGKLSYGITTGNSYMDHLAGSYLLSLGEFLIDNFENTEYRTYAWIYYIIGTIILYIGLLNMIIAILGDTYSKVMDQVDRYGLGVCPTIYADYFFLLNKPKF